MKAEPRLRVQVAKVEDRSSDNSVAAKARRQKTTEPAKSEPVAPPLSVAQKRQLARDFYLKQGYGLKRIDSHLAGIDFNQPVELVTLPKGTRLLQWQAPGAPQGNYYAPLGTSTAQLGISPAALDPETGEIVNRVATTYVTNNEVEVLKSTAAAVNDTWSIPGRVIVTEGKGVQVLSARSTAFDAIGAGE